MVFPLVLTGLFSVTCLSLGGLVSRAVSRERGDVLGPLGTPAADFLLGLGVLSSAWELLALFGWLSPPVVAFVLVASFLGGVRIAWGRVGVAAERIRVLLRGLRGEPPEWQAAILLTLALVASCGMASVVPPEAHGDAEAYYMAVPKVVAASHRLVPFPTFERFMEVGLTGEMNLAALMSLGAGTQAKTLAFPVAIAAAVMLVSLGGLSGLGLHGRWLLVAMTFTSTAFTRKIWDGKLDLIATATGLAALCFALLSERGERKGHLRLAGLFGGMAVVSKLSYAVIVPPALLLTLLVRREGPGEGGASLRLTSPRRLGGALVTLSAFAALSMAPNIFKNAVLFGEPLAPVVSSAGGGLIWQSWFQASTVMRILLTYPFALVYGHFWAQEGNLSPLFLAFTPLAVLLPRGNLLKGPLLWVVASGASGLVLWTLYRPTVFAPRYVMASLMVLLLVGARAAEHSLSMGPSGGALLKNGVLLSLILSLVMGIVDVGEQAKGGFLLATGSLTECDFARPYCRAAKILNNQADPAERVFMQAGFRFFLRPDLLQCLQSGQESGGLPALKPMEERWRYLHERGFRYVAIDRFLVKDVSAYLDPKMAPRWLTVVPLVEEGGWVTLYRLDPSEEQPTPRFRCVEVGPLVWRAESVPAASGEGPGGNKSTEGTR